MDFHLYGDGYEGCTIYPLRSIELLSVVGVEFGDGRGDSAT